MGPSMYMKETGDSWIDGNRSLGPSIVGGHSELESARKQMVLETGM